ncbi:hypothetical protein [Sphingomonas sp. DT-51]|uniref:hypothetical protein n=1 Tax=Sphingomonas sp. DT-51 TaxID=3396165 RepID=UPI003F53EF4C
MMDAAQCPEGGKEPRRSRRIDVAHITRVFHMAATTIGALIGGAIDAMSGEDSAADGALYGAITANVLKLVLPVAVTYAVGWGVLKGLETLGDTISERVKA